MGGVSGPVAVPHGPPGLIPEATGAAVLDPWEAAWAPYDEATYQAVLAAIGPEDVVLDIGAGDLRLARRMAAVARRVIAWERRPEILALAPKPLPANLEMICTDARLEPIPAGVTVAVLLMRHCRHYRHYVARLRAAGCQRLITNARWHLDVEVIDLSPAMPWTALTMGWYACRRCGAVGFAETDPTRITAETLAVVQDVEGCPGCADG